MAAAAEIQTSCWGLRWGQKFLEKGNEREWFLFYVNYISLPISLCSIGHTPGDFVQETSMFETNCSLLLNSAAGNEVKDADKAFP